MALPLDIHRLDGPYRGDEIRYLVLGVAGAAPRPDILLARGLGSMLELAYLREVPLTHDSECPPRQVRLGANLSEAGT
jgi:hypothetical protein